MKVEGREIRPMTPRDVREMVAYIGKHRTTEVPIEVAMAGETPGDDRSAGWATVAAYEQTGTTWWIESIDPWRFGWTENEPWPTEEMRVRVQQGPPKP